MCVYTPYLKQAAKSLPKCFAKLYKIEVLNFKKKKKKNLNVKIKQRQSQALLPIHKSTGVIHMQVLRQALGAYMNHMCQF